jgi:hypothetical protein
MKELGWTRQRLADALNMRENGGSPLAKSSS